MTQYGLKFQQERLKLKDCRRQQQEQEEQEKRDLNHRNKYANGYKYYYWKGTQTWIHTNIFDPQMELYRTYETKNGEDYFKSEEDLRNYLWADNIKLTWFREL